MPSRRSLIVLFLLAVALPVASFADDVLFVLVDLPNHRAYVPEGSTIPRGVAIRAEPVQGRAGALDLGDRSVGSRSGVATRNLNRPTSPPLVFEYAAVERFAQARRQYEAQRLMAAERHDARVVAKTQSCSSIYVTDSKTGVYGTYYNGFTSTLCFPSGGLTSGNAYLWEFTAAGDYTDDDEWIDPYAVINDENNNYHCFHIAYGYQSPVSCTASATTTLLQVGCLNTVYTTGLLYVIEYLNNYQPNYLGYVLSVDYCTYFY